MTYKPESFELTTFFDAGNSGTSKTINWRAGRNQTLVLTDDCTIDFSGDEVEGAELLLTIIQSTTQRYRFRFPKDVYWGINPVNYFLDYGDAIQIRMRRSTGIVPADGWGATVAAVDLAGDGRDVAISPDGNWIAIARSNAPAVIVYRRNKITGELIARMPDPSGIPANATCVGWTPDSQMLLLGSGTSPYLLAWIWGYGGALGSPFIPSPGPSNALQRIRISPDGRWVAISQGSPPYLEVWALSHDGFGAQVSAPSSDAGGTDNGVDWHPSQRYIVGCVQASPYINGYPWDDSSGFGVLLARPSPFGLSGGEDIRFSNWGDYVALVHGADPSISIWAFGEGFGSQVFGISGNGYSRGRDAVWSMRDEFIYLHHNASPYIAAQNWDDGWGTGCGRSVR